MTPEIVALLDIAPAGERVVIEARVSAPAPRPLQWRLDVSTSGPGGTSNISQSGRTDGMMGAPLGHVSVGRRAVGAAVLTVEEAGKLVVSTRRELRPID